MESKEYFEITIEMSEESNMNALEKMENEAKSLLEEIQKIKERDSRNDVAYTLSNYMNNIMKLANGIDIESTKIEVMKKAISCMEEKN